MRHQPKPQVEFTNLSLAIGLGAALWAIVGAVVWFFPYVVLFVVGTLLVGAGLYFGAMAVLVGYQIRHGEEP
jgi:Fe2+ transport system protein B